MAEFLIQAKSHWMEDMTPQEINALPEKMVKARNARVQIGDIVVVRPDGWIWGNEENLPRYFVIKAPGVPVEDVEHLMYPLMDDAIPDGTKHVMLKRKKYQIPQGWMNTHQGLDVITLTQAEIDLVLANIVEKTE